jgi:hypothetical protein
MNPELIRMKTHERALEEFIGGPVHARYVEARKKELMAVCQAILDVDPVGRAEEIEEYKLRGEKRVLEELVNSFTTILEDLKDQISDLEDEEAGIPTPARTRMPEESGNLTVSRTTR